jgi:filamentous hemagglutinin family protein
MRKSFWKCSLHYFLVISFLNAQVSPVFADGTKPPAVGALKVDPSSSANCPKLEVSGSGVPIVNIVAPNAAGLSHNKFYDFNVGTRGIVLNNSREWGTSLNAGIVLGNPNLHASQHARIILNEVTSTNKSLIAGVTEIFGNSAEYILANPNGIMVNGAGFINTPRATFSTGTPELDPKTGRIQSLLVDRGTVTISGEGINITGMDAFDIVSRAAKINAKIIDDNKRAKVQVLTGPQRYDYKRRSTSATGKGRGKKPTWGIDGSALGGLYAGRITLVATEKGVGVKAPENMAARVEDITITADGNIHLSNVDAKRAIRVNSVDGTLTVVKGKKVHAATSLNLKVGHEVLIQKGAKVQTNGPAYIESETFQNRGDLFVGKHSEVIATQNLTNEMGSKILSLDDLSIKTGSLKNNGLILGAKALQIDASIEALNEGAGKIIAGGDFTLNTATLRNTGDIYGAMVLGLNATTRATNEEKGIIQALGDLSIKGGAYLENKGWIKGQSKVTSEAHEIQNQEKGIISAGGELTLVGAIFGNEGETKSNSHIKARLTDTITNKGTISSAAGIDLQSGKSFQTYKNSKILAKDPLVISAGDLQHQGLIQGEKGVTVTVTDATKVYQDGQILAQGDLSIKAKTLDNQGLLEGKQGATLDVANAAKNSSRGKILSGNTMSLKAGTLDNEGLVQSQDDAVVNVASNITNKKNAQILSKGKLTFTTQSLANDGKVQAEKDVFIEALTLKNHRDGEIASGQILTLTGGTVDNDGILRSGAAFNTRLKGNLLNKGLMYSGLGIDFKVDGNIENDKGNMLSHLEIIMAGLSQDKAASIVNKSGLIESFSGNITFKGKTIKNLRDRVFIERRETARTGDGNTGSVTMTDIYEPALYDLEAKIVAASGISFEADEMLNKHSLIAGGGDVTLNGKKFENPSTKLQSRTTHWWHTTVTTRKRGGLNAKVFGSGGSTHRPRHENISDKDVGIVPSTVQAGGLLKGKFKESIHEFNGLKENKAFIGRQAPSNRDQQHQETLVEFQKFMDAAQSSPLYHFIVPLEEVKPVSVDNPEASRPSPLHDDHPTPHPYIIETRAIHVDPKLFFGSDYFLSRMDIFKDKTHYQKRLGDAFVETQLIRGQIFKATGRYFLKGFTNEYQMMKTLYDNAIEQAESLELTPGLSLSKAQVERLQKDMIWMEYQTIRGQKVLVPTIYFAKVTDENYDPESGKLLGREVDLESKDIHLTGLVRGDQKTSIKADDNAVLLGAHVDGGETKVEAGKGLAVLSSLIEGDTVTAKGAQTVLETLVSRHTFSTGFQDSLHARTKIKSRKGDVAVEGTEGLIARGAEVESAKDIKLNTAGVLGLGAQQVSGHVHAEAKNFSYDQQTQSNLKSDLKAKGNVLTESGGATHLVGVDATAGGRIHVKSGETIDSDTVHEIHQKSVQMSSSGGGLFGSKTSKDSQSFSQGVNANKFTAGAEGTLLEAEGTITDRASQYKGPARLKSHKDKVRLLTDKSKQFSHEKKSSSDIVWQSKSDRGSSDEQVHMVQAPDGLKAEGAKGVDVEIKAHGNLAQSIAALEQMPGTAWVKDLAKDPTVTWGLISEAHEHWNYKSQGLTPAASAVLALAVTIATGGAGSTFGAAVAGNSAVASAAASVGISQAAMAGMVSVGFKTLVAQATVSLVNNQGDLGKVLKDMGSQSNLRSLAAAVVTAGLVSHAGLPVQPTGFTGHLQASAIKSTIGAGVSLAMEGGNLNSAMNNIARGTVAGTIGGVVANEISAGYGADLMDPITHKVLHGVLGAATGAILSDDLRSGVWSGAIGGVVSEVAADMMKKGAEDRALERSLQAAAEGRPFSQIEMKEAFAEEAHKVADLSRLAAATTALGLGQNVNISLATGTNAVENNFVPLVVAGIWVAGGIWTAYDTYTTFQEKGVDAAVEKLVVDGLVTVATGAAGKLVMKGATRAGYYVAGKYCATAEQAWAAAVNQSPLLSKVVAKGSAYVGKVKAVASSVGASATIQRLNMASDSVEALQQKVARKLGIGNQAKLSDFIADEQGAGRGLGNPSLPHTTLKEAPKRITAQGTPNAGGTINSFVTEQEEVYYRVYSGTNNSGAFLSKVRPKNTMLAQEGLSLPPSNTAKFIQEVIVPAEIRLQRSRALPVPEWGKRGGMEQFQVLNRRDLEKITFKEGVIFK